MATQLRDPNQSGRPVIIKPGGYGAVNGATVSVLEKGDEHFHQSIITMADTPITVGNTTGVSFGGVKIYDFPAGRIGLLGATVSALTVDLTDAGNATPIDADDGGDFAFGTTVAGDGTLTAGDVNIIPSHSIDPMSAGSAGAALAAMAQFDGTTTPIDVYLNMLIDDADVGDAASDILLISGVLTLTWVALGDY